MLEDDAGSRIPVDDAVQHELDRRSCGCERVVDDLTGDAGCRWQLQSRMHEHHGLAAVKFRSEGLKGGITEVFVAIVAEEDHAIGPECIERIREFRQRTVDVRERHRQSGPAAWRPDPRCNR
ncbi:MAG: hypothetical protein QOG73_127 [Acetobacteraceae bacterium]|nr:hypothetical protein [Acetobacteraceae bacterium]